MIFKKIILALFALCVFWFPQTAKAQYFFLDGGSFQNNSRISSTSILSLEGEGKIFPQLFLGEHFRGGDRLMFGGLGFGMRTGTKGVFLENTFGVAYLSHATSRLGTHIQFRSAGFVVWAVNKDLQLRLGVQHLSNGGRFTGLHGPNSGETFITLGSSFSFK
ncbi:MAG: acyloxyacyl hydrolase [Candidatus Liptonbacteria bacterium]|nr:acyloxyacyl hydrolase [Candidatus Liptonbacteria bacterium]